MPLVQDLSRAQIAFQVAGRTLDEFEVMRYRGTEGLCQLYRFEIDLVTPEEGPALESVVGKAAVLSINTPHGERWFHGIISRFEMSGEAVGQTYFRAELVPAAWLMTHRYHCRIFQNKTIQEIITKLYEECGIAADRFRFNLKGTYEPREYCVQYRETDYNFICRLMEEEGIFWYFEHTQEGHTLVMEDSNASAPAIEGDPKLAFRPPTQLNVDIEHVFRFRLSQSVRPGAVVLNDFNFENPKLALESKADNGRDPGLEFIDYPGEYIDQGRGGGLAKLRAEEFESARIVGVGQSSCKRLTPGKVFELTEHASAGFNGKYYVTTLVHEGKQSVRRTTAAGSARGSVLDTRLYQSLIQQTLAATTNREQDAPIRELAAAVLQIAERIRAGDPTARRSLTQWMYHAGQVARDLSSAATAAGANPLEWLVLPNLIDDHVRQSVIDFDAPVYQCRFECIKATTPYRPARVTPWPVVRGTQTARVVGKQGEEIDTDKYGRVKVQFHWDREGKFDEKSSCWIRVSQGMAGGNYGIMFLPRIGQEVVVDFLEGDPDKPLIVGRVYNADQMPPYPLPDEKTKSCIKTNSSKGGGGTNEIRFEDLKGKEEVLIYAQKDLHIRVNNDRVENVDHHRYLTVKENKFELVKKNKNAEVKLDFSEKIGGKKSLAVTGDIGEEVGGNHSEKVTGKLYLKAGGDVVIESGSGITLKCGGNFVKVDSAGVTILGTQVKINSGGSAGSGSPVSLKAPEALIDAITAKPGKDVTYSGGGQLVAGLVTSGIAGYDFPAEEEEEKKTSWIEIELVDEIGQPVPNEAYEITAPDGTTIKRGTLDKNGQAHVPVSEPGTCQITFPNLDAAAWERLG